jgi:hypothetical protein
VHFDKEFLNNIYCIAFLGVLERWLLSQIFCMSNPCFFLLKILSDHVEFATLNYSFFFNALKLGDRSFSSFEFGV